MIRVRLTFIHKILTASALAILLSTPLAAMEREAPAADQVFVHEWIAGLWNVLTTWFTGGVVPTSPRHEPPPQSTTDSGCAVDPHGGCGG